MKLTKADREDFIDAVMADVPQIDYEEQIRTAVLAHVVGLLPPKVRAVWDDEDLRPYIEMQSVQVEYPEPRRERDYCKHGFSVAVPSIEYQVARNEAHVAAEPYSAKWEAQHEQRKALRQRLATVAYSAKTLEELAGALPEFKKYMPAEPPVATKNLPALATSVADDLRSAGWPKDKVVA